MMLKVTEQGERVMERMTDLGKEIEGDLTADGESEGQVCKVLSHGLHHSRPDVVFLPHAQ
eukprot:34283-Eustigmatos_ZCMA.PRE.1